MLVAPLLLACCFGPLVCRYTVRDIGFVDLAGPAYELCFVGDDALLADGGYERMHQDGNVRFASIDPETDPEHPAVRALGPRGEGQHAAWVLTTDGKEPLVIWPWSGFAPAAARTLALESELRDRIQSEALDSFAFVLLVEGPDPESNTAAREAIERAERELARLSTQLPRPIVHPVRHLTLTRVARGSETVLLWSLGLDAADAAREPAVCVLYGRGKLAGKVMDVAALEDGELLVQLALVGESCECDTTRDWMAEPVIPLAWTDSQRKGAWDALGFDPDSPMVKAEVASILRRGPGPNAARAGNIMGGARDELEALVFGYRETTLGTETLRPAAGAEPEPSTTPGSAGLRAIEAGEGDWAFDDDEGEAETSPDDPDTTGSRPTWYAIAGAIFAFCCASAFAATRIWLRRRAA